MSEWYRISNADNIDSPALVVYRKRVINNILVLKSKINDIDRLRPHVKTHKTKEVAVLMLQAGITKFKCATISEAEMLAIAGAPDVLLAWQPIGPKLERFVALIKKYPATTFSCLADTFLTAKNFAATAIVNHITIRIYLDINNGMNRTGIQPGDKAIELYKSCTRLRRLEVAGLHVYDGHIRSIDIQQRFIDCNEAFEPVTAMKEKLLANGCQVPVVIAGGSPTYPVHAKRENVECSPGTFIYWDKGYAETCPEQDFQPAALIISRIISLPSETKICLDLGHKSVGSENELQKRVYFLNAPELKFISHSEEHLVADAGKDHHYQIGDLLYGLPYHICPTAALYERVIVIENERSVGEWKVIGRDRKIEV